MENDEKTSRNHEKVLGRLLALSDGVFAFAITLLILNVALPDGTTRDVLPQALIALWPKYLAFLISFFVIGLYWMVHVRQFRAIRRYTSGLLWLNLVFLLFIVAIPFATSILSSFQGAITVAIYAAIMSLAGYTASALWIYATYKRRLVDEKLSHEQVKRGIIMNLIAPVMFTLSIGVALINDDMATYSWILIFVLYVIANRAFKLPKADDDI